ncbi:MAG TPA: phosphoribosyltransferase family protein [Acidimicrobiales bacterium]
MSTKRYNPVRACPVCGLALSWPGADGVCPNRWCRRADRSFSVVFSIGVHTGALRHALLRYKYQEERWWAPHFARMVGGYLHANGTWFEEFDLLAAVPGYVGAGARRRWDPVRQILVEVASLPRLSWRVEPDLILKRAETPAMQGLDWAARQAVASGRLRDALAVPVPGLVKGCRVLVFDDVMTEGSTLREVARALRLAGAAEVAGLVLARPTWSERREARGRGGGS